jgi:hypothetical protein
MVAIPGVYVAIRGDYDQLRKDFDAAKALVSAKSKEISNELNNALDTSQISKGINALVSDLGKLERTSKMSADSFGAISSNLGQLQKITGLTRLEFEALQSKMLQTSTANQQEKSFLSIARAASLTRAEISDLGNKFGLSAAGIDKVTASLYGQIPALEMVATLSQKAQAGLFQGYKGQTAAFANDLTALSRGGQIAGAAMSSLSFDMAELQKHSKMSAEDFGILQGKFLNTQAANSQINALRNISTSAGLTNAEIRSLGQQFGMSASQIESVVTPINKVSESSDTLMGKMGRMVAVVAAYSLVFGAFTKIMEGLANVMGPKFNATMEVAQLGIGASFLTAGSYKGSGGNTLEGLDALKAAKGEAADIMKELQAANMRTSATLDQLMRAYQETLPVAMAKGFDKHMVVEFTTAMMQAASVIDASGMLMNQLQEETRSLLTGAINPKNSRIATVLGVTPDDISKLKGDAQGLFAF